MTATPEAKVLAARVRGGMHGCSRPPRSTPWRPDYVTLAFGRLTRQLGFQNLRLHVLRHFAAATMLLGGVDVRTAAGRLGHARPSTTLDIYAHYAGPADRHAAATLADALDHATR